MRLPTTPTQAIALLAILLLILVVIYMATASPFPGSTEVHVDDGPTFYSPTPLGHGNPFAMVILAKDIQYLLSSVAELDNSVMKSGLVDKYALSRCLMLVNVVARRYEANLQDYVKQTKGHVDRIILSSTYSILVAQSSPSLWNQLRAFLSLSKLAKHYDGTENRPLLDAVSITLKMYLVLHRDFGPQGHTIYQFLNKLEVYLEDIVIILSKDVSSKARALHADDSAFTSYHPADVALRARLLDLARRLKRSVGDTRGHLNFLEAVIDNLRETSLKTLRVDGPFPIQNALASLARDCTRLLDELDMSDSWSI